MQEAENYTLVAQWYEKYHEALLRRWSGTLSAQDGRELAQEVFLRLLRTRDLSLIRHPRAYLFRIAGHVVAEWRAHEDLFSPLDDRYWCADVAPTDRLDLEQADADVGFTSVAEGRNVHRLKQALDKLPLVLRTTVVLHAQHGMSYDEIATHMQVSKRMVKRYIVKGYAQLRRQLTEE